MPKIFFVRDGTGDHKTSDGKPIAMSTATGLSNRFPPRFTVSGPTINAGIASAFAAFRHVVMEVEADELNMEYPKAGFYYFVGLTPQEAKRILGVNPQ